MDKVSLIIITALTGKAYPIHLAPGLQGAKGALKTADATETFWTQADNPAEPVDEMLVAHSRIRSDTSDGYSLGSGNECVDCRCDTRSGPGCAE